MKSCQPKFKQLHDVRPAEAEDSAKLDISIQQLSRVGLLGVGYQRCHEQLGSTFCAG
jgi:hypothetical protein